MRVIGKGTRPYLLRSLKINCYKGRPIYEIANCTDCLGQKYLDKSALESMHRALSKSVMFILSSLYYFVVCAELYDVVQGLYSYRIDQTLYETSFYYQS